MAQAVENSQLHKRIAINILMKIGTNPNFVMLAFMITTAFLSMWISNTASTAMMIPIAQAVAVTLEGVTIILYLSFYLNLVMTNLVLLLLLLLLVCKLLTDTYKFLGQNN